MQRNVYSCELETLFTAGAPTPCVYIRAKEGEETIQYVDVMSLYP